MITDSRTFKALRSLFWDFCRASKSLFVGSKSFHLTQPNSYRPYLSLEMKRPWLIFKRSVCPIEFFSLLIKNSLWLRLDNSPPVPWTCSDLFWLLSKVIPSNLALYIFILPNSSVHPSNHPPTHPTTLHGPWNRSQTMPGQSVKFFSCSTTTSTH